MCLNYCGRVGKGVRNNQIFFSWGGLGKMIKIWFADIRCYIDEGAFFL